MLDGLRFYDPLFGVFLSADPISPLGGSSPRLNRYAYVGYDPVNFVDPTGLFVQDAWNTIADFAVQAFGYYYVLPINLVTTGRWEATWDEETTEGAIKFGIAVGVGAACSAITLNPVVGGMCAGAVLGGIQTAVAGGDWQDIAFGGALTGAVFGGFAGGAGGIGNAAVYNLTGSRASAALAGVAASTGASVGAQLSFGGKVNGWQVVASGVVSGLIAWHKGAQQDAAVGQAAGEAAGRASGAVAGHTRAAGEPQPGYATAWEAGRAALQRSVGPSHATGHEYGGLVYRRNGRYFFTEPHTNDSSLGVEVWDAAPRVPRDAAIVGDYHTHPSFVPGTHRSEWYLSNGDSFSGTGAQYTMSTKSTLMGTDIFGARNDLLVRPNVDAKAFTSFLSTPTGRFGVHHVSSGTIFYFDPSQQLLPPGIEVQPGYYAH